MLLERNPLSARADCDERLFWAKLRLGNAYKVQERYEIALDTIREGLAIILKSDPPNWYHIVGVEDLIATVMTAQGKTEEANEITRRLATLKETLEEVSTDVA
jgi:tetratricopeptide (TPR) repeat protein